MKAAAERAVKHITRRPGIPGALRRLSRERMSMEFGTIPLALSGNT